MWLSKHGGGQWRMYVYVPIGAAIFVSGLVLLASAPIRRIRRRQALVVGLSLLLIWPGLSRLYRQQAAIQDSASAKAGVLRNIVEQAPAFHEGAHLMLFTTMSGEALEQAGVREMRSNMFESAMYMLYQERRPIVSFLCIFGHGCSCDDTFLQYISRDFLGDEEDYSDVVMFQLHDDLRVELLRELPPELRAARQQPIRPRAPDRLLRARAAARAFAAGFRLGRLNALVSAGLIWDNGCIASSRAGSAGHGQAQTQETQYLADRAGSGAPGCRRDGRARQ